MCKTVAVQEWKNKYDRVLWGTVMENVGDVCLLIRTDQQIQAYDERNIINFIFIFNFFVVWNIQQIYTIKKRAVGQTIVQSRRHSECFKRLNTVELMNMCPSSGRTRQTHPTEM